MAQANQLRQPLPEVMVGSSTEVSERLHRAAVPHALAITFSGDSQQLVFEGVFRQVTAFLPQLIRQRQTDTLEKIVGALLPDIAISDAALAEARMMVDAKSTILRSDDFLPAGDIAKMASYSPQESLRPTEQVEARQSHLRLPAQRHRLLPPLRPRPRRELPPLQSLGRCLEDLWRDEERLGYGLLVCGTQQLSERPAPAGLVGESA
jgi:hypothetical protein